MPNQPPPGGRSAPLPVTVRGEERRALLGKTVGGKYLIRTVLGVGGMGTVFDAEAIGTGTAVALKVLHATQAARQVSVTRFYQEARAASSINHPNVCRVYDMGTLEDGSPYMVMERLLGESLSQTITREQGMPVDEVIDILVQVVSGLDFAHRAGVIHRDIKPENIFLTHLRNEYGLPIVKVVDFGVSKIMPAATGEEELNLTRTGMVMGTPFYMSPEQARGERDLDGRVDIYAAGVLLYEALSGRRPFLAPNYNALLMQILSNDPRPLREFRTDVPAEVERIMRKAMHRNRNSRYATAHELLLDLIRVQETFAPTQSSQETQFGLIRSLDFDDAETNIAQSPFGDHPQNSPPHSARPPSARPPIPRPQIPSPHIMSPQSARPRSPHQQAPHQQAPHQPAPHQQASRQHQRSYLTPSSIEIPEYSDVTEQKLPEIALSPATPGDFDDLPTTIEPPQSERERDLFGFDEDANTTQQKRPAPRPAAGAAPRKTATDEVTKIDRRPAKPKR